MITGPRKDFEYRASSRGYTLEEVMPSVVSQEGDLWTVDENHPSYPRQRVEPPKNRPVIVPPEGGPGTELKSLLKDWLGIVAAPNCSCNARARQMDLWGPDECERRLPEIVGWLEEQAGARKLPFVRFAAEQAVKLAIRRARKAAAR